MKYHYPKIELHLHLDGSIRPETVWELYQKEGLVPEGVTYEAFTRDAAVLEPCQDVNDCLTKFDLPLKIMQDTESITRITKELICDLAAQDVVYGDIRFAPQLHTQKGLSQKEVIPSQVNAFLESVGSTPLQNKSTLAELLKRPELNYALLAEIDPDRPELSRHSLTRVEVTIKYEGYITKQYQQIEKFKRLETKKLDPEFDYQSLDGLRIEAKQKLSQITKLPIM